MLRRTYDSGLSSDRAPGWAAVSSCASERAQQKEKELKAKSEAIPKRSQPHRLLPSPDTRCHSLTLAAVLALRFTKTQTAALQATAGTTGTTGTPRPQNRHQGPPSSESSLLVLGIHRAADPREPCRARCIDTSLAPGPWVPLWPFVPMCSSCLGLKSGVPVLF